MFLEAIRRRFIRSDEPRFEKDEAKKIIQEARDVLGESKRQKDLLELMANTVGGMVWIKKFDHIQETYT